MTAWHEDRARSAHGSQRTSRSEREHAVDVLKAAFIRGRLAKAEFDQRVGQALASRTYAELGALTADLPDEVASAVTPAQTAREPARALSVATAARVGAVAAVPSVAAAGVTMMQSGVSVITGALAVGLTGVSVAALLTALLVVLSWAVRRVQRQHSRTPPQQPGGLSSRRPPAARHLPPGRDPGQLSEKVVRGAPRLQVC